jgi:hypothetical protein
VLGAGSWFCALVSRWPDSLSRCYFLVLAATGQRSGLAVPIPSAWSRLGAPVCAASENLVVLLRFSVREPQEPVACCSHFPAS